MCVKRCVWAKQRLAAHPCFSTNDCSREQLTSFTLYPKKLFSHVNFKQILCIGIFIDVSIFVCLKSIKRKYATKEDQNMMKSHKYKQKDKYTKIQIYIYISQHYYTLQTASPKVITTASNISICLITSTLQKFGKPPSHFRDYLI